MKMPQRPPKMEDFIEPGLDWRAMTRAMSTVTETISGKYLHWHKLRFYQPPDDLTLEQWWFVIKIKRMGQARWISLVDKIGREFSYNLVDPLPEFLHLVDSEARGSIRVPEPITNPETKKSYLMRSLMEEAITSSQLEGAQTSIKVAKDMIRQGRKPRDLSERMILNNYQAMQHILEIKDQDLTSELIFEIHRIVTENTLKDPTAAGRLRRPEELVVVDDPYGEVLHEPPAASELGDRMEAMCAFANGDKPGGFLHPVLRSMILHFWLAYDHPFLDGNGRTARALFYWSMLRHGYWLFEFIPISRIILQAPTKYTTAYLYTETDDNDLTYFLLYHADVIRRAIADLHLYLERRTRQVREAVAELRGLTELNHRQRALINHALRHQGFVYTVESHKNPNNTSYETARHDLMDLTDRNLLHKYRSGRFWQFVAVDDLEAKLKDPGRKSKSGGSA
jgi:Fic family protein